uniref:Uncharacterized protein n=1 Tax=Panagrolaimus sp. JU765 TaxID=591449 RepID=A0AC34R570_9BILA
MDISTVTEEISECKERIFCSLIYYSTLIVGSFIILVVLSVVAKVILNLVNAIVVGLLHAVDVCCVSKLAPKDDEYTQELFELRDRTLSWNKNALTKVHLLKKDFNELKRRSKRIASIVHFPGV